MTPRRSRPQEITLAELKSPITLPAAVKWLTPLEPTIMWKTLHPSAPPLALSFYLEIPTEQRFALAITESDLAPSLRNEQEPEAAAAWRRLAGLPGVKVETLADQPGERGVIVGELSVTVFNDRVRAASGESWFTAVDRLDSGVAELVAAIDDDPEVGIPGSVFVFEELDVHPAFRGQRLGARLMASATFLLLDDYDTAVLEAYPKIGAFDKERSPETQETVDQLVTYYARLGFKRWKPRRKREPESPADIDAVPMIFRGEWYPGWERSLQWRPDGG